MGSHFLLQGIFLTQGLNPGLPHCKQILYCLSQQGSLKVSQSGAYFYFLNKSLALNQIIFFFILPLNTLAHYIYVCVYIQQLRGWEMWKQQQKWFKDKEKLLIQ